MSVENVITDIKGLGNIINWNPNGSISFSNTATVDISRCELSNNIYGDYVDFENDITLTTNSILDYDIKMRKNYKYKLKIDYKTTDSDGNPNIDEKIVFIRSLSEQVSNCSASYNYTTNSITVNWDHIKSQSNNILIESTLSYNVWICRKSHDNDLVRFHTNTTSFTISNGDQGNSYVINDGGEQVGTTTFSVKKGLYFIYVTPKFITQVNTTTYTSQIESSAFKANNIVVSPPDNRVLIDPKSPTNFKITSPYNGEIAFSWQQPVTDNNVFPTQYRIEFTNTSLSPNTTTTKTINGNNKTYILNNTDLSLTGALQPGDYDVSMCAIYNSSLESDLSSTLNFSIPITKIEFSLKLVDQYGNITNNIKNGVSGLVLNWNSLSYTTYYKIEVQQFDELGNTQDTEIYYTNNNSISLAWYFSNNKSRFIFNISYTTDTSLVNNPPESSTNALGQSYLDPTGTYNPIFTAANQVNLPNVNLGGGIIARTVNVGGE